MDYLVAPQKKKKCPEATAWNLRKLYYTAKDVIKFSISSGGAYPSLCGWALNAITYILIKEKQSSSEREEEKAVCP